MSEKQGTMDRQDPQTIAFGHDDKGPFVKVTLTMRDQDDTPRFNFYALSSEDQTKVCDHLPRAVNGRPAMARHDL